jgi:DNA polymerase III delta prime subunit
VPARQADPNRRRMLAKVRRDWIDGYLKHSLDNLARIELGLEEKPAAVSRPWDVIVQQPDRAPRPLPPGQPMGVVFDELGQALLILGAPGAGKTTLLLELARDLLDRAEQDATHPIPVVFHLSSWAVRRRPLTDWMIDELAERYYVPRKLAQAWIADDQVLPLLDGLDEVAPEHRAACVEAINIFRRRQHGLIPLAVCSRVADYHALPVRVELSGAVVIEPLSREQVSTYLKQAGKPLAGVRTALRDDEKLWELLQTPLMLSIVALAYQGRSAAEVRATGSLEQRRTHLFANYTERMFERRAEVTEYTREQTICWLTWLARSMMHNNLSVFYMERMQPDWLPSRAQRRIVAVGPIWLVFGLVGGLVGGLSGGLVAGLVDGLVFGLVAGLVGVLIVVLRGLLSDEWNRITPAETLRWSWRKAQWPAASGLYGGLVGGLLSGPPQNELAGWLFVGLSLVLFFGVIVGLTAGRLGGLFVGVVVGLVGGSSGGLVLGLVAGLVGGLSVDPIITRTIPNEGIRRSLRNALISFLFVGLAVGLLFSWLDSGLHFGLVVGLVVGLPFGLKNGGLAYLAHYTLRILLWRNDYAPWNYIRFLDYAAERVFLRRVGGGYIFTHRLLMEYFATLQPTDQARQIKTE